MNTKLRIVIACFFVVLVAMFTIPARGQNDGYLTDSNTRGFAPGNSFQSADIDNINLANGALQLHIPLIQRKGRGLDRTAFVTYNSKIWAVTPVWDLINNTLIGVDWGFSSETTWLAGFAISGGGGGRLTYSDDQASCTVNNVGYNETVHFGFKYIEPDGTAYQFPNRHIITDPPGPIRCFTGSTNFNIGYSDNGTLELDTTTMPYVVYYKDGRRKIDLGSYKDTNGNYIDANGDTLKRTLSISGGQLNVIDSNGSSQTYSFQYSGQATATTQFPTPSVCNGTKPIYQYTQTMGGTSTLTLPSGATYVFTYDPIFNEITKVQLPTGGYIRYQYVTLPAWDKGPYYQQASCAVVLDSRRLSARFVSPDGSAQHEQQWQYSYSAPNALQHQTSVTDPFGNVTVHTFGTSDGAVDLMHETLAQYYDNASHPLRTVSSTWVNDRMPQQLPLKGPTTCGPANWRKTSETTTLADTNQVTQTQTTFDTFAYNSGNCGSTSASRGNIISQSEYDWGPGAAGPLLRRSVYTYLHDSNSNYVTKHILDRVTSKTVYDSISNLCQGLSRACAQTTYGYDTTSIATKGGVVQHDYANYPSTMVYRGNRTTVSNWRNTDAALLTTTYNYDELGNLNQATDPLSHSTSFEYTDSWSGTACIPSGGTANAFVTKITNALTQFTTAKYFPCSSMTASATDLNSNTTSLTYDGLDRLTQTSFPDGGLRTNCYSDTSSSSCYSASLPPFAITTAKITSAVNRMSTTQVDGLSRVIQTQLSDPEGTDYVDITYDALGRKSTVSNPYRSTSDVTYGITTSNYDALGRVTTLIPPDGTASANNVTTSYSGNCVTVTDQAGKARKSCSDGLGRVVRVFEDPAVSNYETDYTYDALSNLLTVNQKGGSANSADWRTRTFVYNSLSQLTSATNPETGPTASSGTITYAYNNDGVLISKTDPRSITTNYNPTESPIDALHRVTKKSYSNSDPSVSYFYDQTSFNGLSITNGIGRRTGMNDAAGAEAWSYDSMGRTRVDLRTTNSVSKSTTYAYNLDGSLASLTYPSGRVIVYTSNAAGRAIFALDSGLNINYAWGNCGPAGNGVCYSPQGAPSFMKNGTVFNSKFLFNSRLQPCWIWVQSNNAGAPTSCTQTGVTIAALLDLQYDFGLGAADNGNVNRIANRRNAGRSITYQYDGLNRIKSAVTDATSGQFCWGQSFVNGYDPWGNLKTITPDSSRPGCPVGTLANTINVYNKIVDTGYGYDNAGNMTTQPGVTSTFNAENQITSAAGVTYVSDGDGKRAKKSNGKLYWYGMGSDPLSESDLSGNVTDDYIFFNGKRIARQNISSGVRYFYFSDHLGSTRVIAQMGVSSACYDAEYYPFGGEAVIATNTCPHNYKFTGKERDSESGLDNFGARYDSSSMGRFMSPDPLGGRLVNPQTLNKYSYVTNNPLNYVDPTGLYKCKDSDKCDSDQDKAFEKARQQDLKSKDPNVVRDAKAYGDKNTDNGVSVQFGDPGTGKNGTTVNDVRVDPNDPSKVQASETVTIRSGLSGTDLAETVGHEGGHVADAQDFVNTIDIKSGGADQLKNLTEYATELKSYLVSNSILTSANEKRNFGDCGLDPCTLGAGVSPARVLENINRLLADPKNGYGVTPANPGPVLYPILTTPK